MTIILNASTDWQEFTIKPMSMTIYDAVMSVVCPTLPCGKKVVLWSGSTFIGDTLRPTSLWGALALVPVTSSMPLSIQNFTGQVIIIPAMTDVSDTSSVSSTKKEIVFEFNADLSSFATVSTFVNYANRLLSLIGGTGIYIEGTKLVVVM